MAGNGKKSSKATGKAKKAAIKATREIKQNKHDDQDKQRTTQEQAE